MRERSEKWRSRDSIYLLLLVVDTILGFVSVFNNNLVEAATLFSVAMLLINTW